MQKKRKRDDPNDVSLCEGKGYFVDPSKMSSYLDSIESEPAVSGNGIVCTKFADW